MDNSLPPTMDNPAKFSASTLGDNNHDHLSTPALSPYSASSHTIDGPPASPRLSTSSMQSGITRVEFDSELQQPTRKKTGYKVITSEVEVKITYWESVKSVLMFWQDRTRKVTAELQVADPDEDMDDNDEHFCSPWIPSVWVLSKEKDSSNRHVQKMAQCTIDTANLQGNLVSRDFLLKELGFSESDFKPLKKSHRHGVSVSGHAVVPDGTVKLTWYHGNSPRVFREMRFFVVPNPLCELVLGARVIQEYGILNPPNFQNGVKDVPHVDDTSDPTYVELNQKKVELEEAIANLQLRIDKTDVKPERKAMLEKQKETKEAELVIAMEAWSKHVAFMNKKRADAEKTKAEAEKKKRPTNNSPSTQNGPQITFTGVKGPSRSSTGFSIRTTSTSRSMRKG